MRLGRATLSAQILSAQILSALILSGRILAASVALATPDDGAATALRGTLDAARGLTVGGQTRTQKLASVRDLARQLVDTKTMGRQAAGAAFAGWSAAQQEEFLVLFDELFVRSYMQKLLLFRDPTFRVGREERGAAGVLVHTEIVAGRDTYEVSYAMRHADDGWRATDVVVEGVSMSSSYSDQFASLLRDRSVEELLALMRRKVEHFRGADAE